MCADHPQQCTNSAPQQLEWRCSGPSARVVFHTQQLPNKPQPPFAVFDRTRTTISVYFDQAGPRTECLGHSQGGSDPLHVVGFPKLAGAFNGRSGLRRRWRPLLFFSSLARIPYLPCLHAFHILYFFSGCARRKVSAAEIQTRARPYDALCDWVHFHRRDLLRYHHDITMVSLPPYHYHTTTVSPRYHYGITTVSLPRHYGIATVSL